MSDSWDIESFNRDNLELVIGGHSYLIAIDEIPELIETLLQYTDREIMMEEIG